MITSISLEDTELVLLDGKCTPKVQERVEEAKQRLAFADKNVDLPKVVAEFIANAVNRAQTDGRLIYCGTQLRDCDFCERKGGYAEYKRTTYPKYGLPHKKGAPDYDKPLYLHGVELVYRLVTMKECVTCGCCWSCWQKWQPNLAKALEEVKAALPKEITGIDPKWIYNERRQCPKCSWIGHEGLMGRRPCIMGGGTYPAICPECKFESTLFGDTFKHVDGFDLTLNTEKKNA